MKTNSSQENDFSEQRRQPGIRITQQSHLEEQHNSFGQNSLSNVKIINSPKKKVTIFIVIGIISLLVLIAIGLYSIKDKNVAQFMSSEQNKLQNENKSNQKKNPIEISYSKTLNNPESIVNTNDFQNVKKQKQSAGEPKADQINKSNKIDFSQQIQTSSKISLVQQQFQRTMTSSYTYECKKLQAMFHYFKQVEKTFYYKTPYQIFIPSCDAVYGFQVNRLIVESWSQQRQVIQWARKYLRHEDSVLFDCPNCKNYLHLILLAKFVGNNGGTVSVTGIQKTRCMNNMRSLNHIENIRFIARQPGIYKKFKNIITFNEIFLTNEIKAGLLKSLPEKMFVKMSGKIESYKTLQKIQNNNKSYVNKVYLNSSDCNSKTRAVQVDNKPGYYQVISKQIFIPQSKQADPPQAQGPFLKQLKEQYQKFKLTIPSPSQRKDIAKITSNFPIPPHKLQEVPQEDIQKWVNQSQVVQWTRNTTKGHQSIFLEQSVRYNLLNLLNIAALVPKGKVTLKAASQRWPTIKKYAEKLGINNIVAADENNEKSALSSAELLILDSLATIKLFFDQNNIEQKKVLAYFDEKTDGSTDSLYKFYVDHYIRRVRIKPSFYYGYEIFDNFLFSSENPTGYFEIQKKTYTIYQFWSQNTIQQINENRKFCIQQITKINSPKVEVKVVTNTLLPYFILKQVPLHKGYQYLSPMQKVDYTRGYFMHFYGGGYADMKHIHFDWFPYFEKLYNGPQDKYAIGYHEIFPHDVGCYQEDQPLICPQMKQNYAKIMGNGQYIFKKGTPLSTQWFNRMQEKLDTNFQNLKTNPYMDTRDFKGKKLIINGKQVISKYPFRWAQMGGATMGRSQWSHFGHYYTDFPYVIPVDYR